MSVELASLAPLLWALGGLVAVYVLTRDRHASSEGPIRIETTGPRPLRPAAYSGRAHTAGRSRPMRR